MATTNDMGKTIEIFGFPAQVTADEVKEFIENHTGDGTVLTVRISKPNDEKARFTFATVRFTSKLGGEYVVAQAAAEKRLWFGSLYLKARKVEREIKTTAAARVHGELERMENVNVQWGNLVSKEEMKVIWKGEKWSVEYGIGVRKLGFYLSYEGVEYKMELCFENILGVQLRCSDDRGSKHFLIQLQGAPRIFKKAPLSSSSRLSSEESTGFRWIRDVDFTPSSCIGQSFALCLELSHGDQLPSFFQTLVGYKESYAPFILHTGSSLSSISNLVPIITPPQGFHISYKILFQINALLQHGYLPGPALDNEFFRLVDPSRFRSDYVEYALDKLFHLKECCYEPQKWLKQQYLSFYSSKQLPWKPNVSLDDGLVYVHRVQITPTKVYFRGPEANLSNRVVRHFIDDVDNFLRVSFVDEELDKLHSIDLSPRTSAENDLRTRVYDRVLSVLRNGIVIGDKKFEFLAFSASQLRENSCWMFASRKGLSAADIRAWMGDFRQIRNVAKYAARLGQSFGSSRRTLCVEQHEIEVISDVEVETNKITYCFSDGIGKISGTLAEKVAEKCGLISHTPSAFQIRYAGYKGVVAIDPTSTKKLSLRKSMLKYTSLDTQVDVLSWSKYQPCFLNRQVINLLSTLGIKDRVFVKKQKEAIDQLDSILEDPSRALEVLELMSPGEMTSILKELLLLYKPNEEPFLNMMLRTFRAAKLLDLRTKSRIFVPKGRTMMGCLDETRTLEYGQVFVHCSLPGRSSESNFVVKGKVVVAKNPCLHPGDVRLLDAVDVKALHHMVDCVVFPQKGERPHPNECSGSDLDGDLYFVGWDPELTRIKPVKPMSYEPAPTMRLDHDVTMGEVQEYLVKYMVNDGLGGIANAHTVFADQKPKKAMTAECIKLAKLFSIAVDFPKTGVPANFPHNLRVREYPDFMEKPDKPTYVSNGVLGKLFRGVKDVSSDVNTVEIFSREVATKCYDPDMEVDGFEDYLSEAFEYKARYDFKLGNLMDYYGIKTEPELISGNILRMAKSFDKRNDMEQISLAMKSLRKEARSWFNEKGSKSAYDEDDNKDEEYAKASAWYRVTYHPDYWGRYNEGMQRDHFLSFPWCVSDKLIQIKREKTCLVNFSPVLTFQD
ncbi:probable RNA-dependent RNA polymerase 1 [Cucurbita pepo subsp. pepo]|uniref:probable RNA-dependent RNA polymerase 1 n=1 Tax=Cucurbita pepo subsp. pepo TaxID=3664 RepID=UPI000C9D9C52|nr:probable RNA-dependent RNA polymerase 1 [Cucurbita pepo subsp. pepo]